MEAYQQLEHLENSIRLIKRDLSRANAFEVTQGTRLKELMAADLVRDLYLTWFSVFGKRASLVPGLEFHRVAAVVATIVGLNIGSKTLIKADDGRVAERIANVRYTRNHKPRRRRS